MTPPKRATKTTHAAAPASGESISTTGTPTEDQLRSLRTLTSEFSIGKRIKEARERPENGLSIEALSRMCKLIDPVERGIAQQTLVKYEKGVVLPGLRELRILSDALDVSTDWLIFGAERGDKGNPVITMDAALLELAAILRERIAKATDPLWFFPTIGNRPKLLAKAREPKPRK
jgi:transcriptional regulator with XRE-family HTH domain